MRILLLLISSTLFCKGITISTDGLGSDQNWNIKSQTGNGSVDINVNENNEFSIDDNSNTLGEFDNETLNHTPNEDGTFNYVDDDSSTNSANFVLGGNDDSTPIPLPSGSKVDTDDDVPTLLSIRSRVHSLQQELTKQAISTRGTTGVVTNFETKEIQSKEVELADLYNVLRQVIPDNEEEELKFEGKVDEKDSALENFKDEVEEFKTEFIEKATDYAKTVKVTEPSGGHMDTRFELDIGSYNFYLDPFQDLYTGGINLGITWDDIKDWISVVVGLLAVFIYFNAIRRDLVELMRTLTLAPYTAPVSNLSIFGNSVGTVGLILIKIAFIASLIVSTTFFGLLTLIESGFSFGGATRSLSAILGDVTPILSGTSGFMINATNLLFDLIPLISISAMFTAYLIQKLASWIVITIGISVSKAAS